jgi:hypothetical protein
MPQILSNRVIKILCKRETCSAMIHMTIPFVLNGLKNCEPSTNGGGPHGDLYF